jgi:single-strand DNA-binding protein
MINKVMLIGNIGTDIELKTMKSGTDVCNFTLATTERWKDKAGQQQENTEWHKIVVYSSLAKVCSQFLKKGSKVYVEGKLQTRQWQDANNVNKYTTEIISNKINFLDKKDGDNDTRTSNNNVPF